MTTTYSGRQQGKTWRMLRSALAEAILGERVLVIAGSDSAKTYMRTMMQEILMKQGRPPRELERTPLDVLESITILVFHNIGTQDTRGRRWTRVYEDHHSVEQRQSMHERRWQETLRELEQS